MAPRNKSKTIDVLQNVAVEHSGTVTHLNVNSIKEDVLGKGGAIQKSKDKDDSESDEYSSEESDNSESDEEINEDEDEDETIETKKNN